MKRAVAIGIVLVGIVFAYFAWRAPRKPAVKAAALSTGNSAADSSGARSTKTSTTAAGAIRPVVSAPKQNGRAKGQVVVHGAWGGEPGQFGRKHDPESNPEMPMAVRAGPNGELDVLDQVNRRLERFRDGKLVGTITTGGDTLQDFAFGKEGRTVMLDRLADQNLQVYDSSGKLVNEVPLVGVGIKEGGEVTGVFSDDDGTYVEREHGALVRVAGPDGQADPLRPQLVGRPTRDGRLLVSAAISERGAGEVTVSAFDRETGQPRWSQPVGLGAPILHIVMLDSDRQGMIYLAGDVGEEGSQPPYPILDERIVIVRLGEGGDLRGVLQIPPFPTADENFRPMSVGDDGSVYVMMETDGGLDVMRYSFP